MNFFLKGFNWTTITWAALTGNSGPPNFFWEIWILAIRGARRVDASIHLSIKPERLSEVVRPYPFSCSQKTLC